MESTPEESGVASYSADPELEAALAEKLQDFEFPSTGESADEHGANHVPTTDEVSSSSLGQLLGVWPYNTYQCTHTDSRNARDLDVLSRLISEDGELAIFDEVQGLDADVNNNQDNAAKNHCDLSTSTENRTVKEEAMEEESHDVPTAATPSVREEVVQSASFSDYEKLGVKDNLTGLMNFNIPMDAFGQANTLRDIVKTPPSVREEVVQSASFSEYDQLGIKDNLTGLISLNTPTGAFGQTDTLRDIAKKAFGNSSRFHESSDSSVKSGCSSDLTEPNTHPATGFPSISQPAIGMVEENLLDTSSQLHLNPSEMVYNPTFHSLAAENQLPPSFVTSTPKLNAKRSPIQYHSTPISHQVTGSTVSSQSQYQRQPSSMINQPLFMNMSTPQWNSDGSTSSCDLFGTQSWAGSSLPGYDSGLASLSSSSLHAEDFLKSMNLSFPLFAGPVFHSQRGAPIEMRRPGWDLLGTNTFSPQGLANVDIRLHNADLWREFHQHCTEMIVTKTGR